MNKQELMMIDSIESSLTMAEAARKSNVSYKCLRNFAIKNNIFKPNSSSKGRRNKKIKELLINDISIDSVYLKRRLVEEKIFNYECFECGIKNWKDKNIVLELDHINGNRLDNTIKNLRLLCPNCHSQTPTFRNKGGKNLVFNLTQDFLLECYDKSSTFNEFCNFLGVKNRGQKNMSTLIDKMISLNMNFEDKYFKNISDKFGNKEIIKNVFCVHCNKQITKNTKNNLCNPCLKIKQRKVQRPSLEQLKKDISETNYFKTGKKYGVSDNAIRKWIKKYESEMAS